MQSNTYPVNLETLLSFVTKGDIHPLEAAQAIREMRESGEHAHVRLSFDRNDYHRIYGVYDRPEYTTGWDYPDTEWFWACENALHLNPNPNQNPNPNPNFTKRI